MLIGSEAVDGIITPISTIKTYLIKLSSLSLFAMLVAASCFVASSASAGLVGEWNFDSSTLTNTGSSGSAHDGTASGTLTYDAANFSAGFDSGQALNVTNGSFSVDNTDSDIGGYLSTFDLDKFSVSFWAKADPTTGAWKSIASNGSTSVGGWDARRWNLNDIMRVDFVSDVNYVKFDGFFDSNWHHVVVTVEGGGGITNDTATVYVDLEAKSVSSFTYIAGPAEAMNFGKMVGLVDEIKFYDSVLTANEVANLHYYNTTNSPPHCHWPHRRMEF